MKMQDKNEKNAKIFPSVSVCEKLNETPPLPQCGRGVQHEIKNDRNLTR